MSIRSISVQISVRINLLSSNQCCIQYTNALTKISLFKFIFKFEYFFFTFLFRQTTCNSVLCSSIQRSHILTEYTYGNSLQKSSSIPSNKSRLFVQDSAAQRKCLLLQFSRPQRLPRAQLLLLLRLGGGRLSVQSDLSLFLHEATGLPGATGEQEVALLQEKQSR